MMQSKITIYNLFLLIFYRKLNNQIIEGK